MTAVRHFALGCCLLCSAAGIVRIFWPENGFKPVINTVLMLYIVASVVPVVRETDWPALARGLRAWARTEPAALHEADLSRYASALGRAEAAAALQRQLAENGITARVRITETLCTVELRSGADLAAAEPIVAAACGALAYELTVLQGGDAP